LIRHRTRAATVFFAAALLLSTSAQAACWMDHYLAAKTREIAQRHFSVVANQPPTVLACTSDEFPPNVGGTYSQGTHEIRIPTWMVGSSELAVALAHELGHAHVRLSGGDWMADGHGTSWVWAMRQAGFDFEVRRVAGYNAGTARVLVDERAGRQPLAQGNEWIGRQAIEQSSLRWVCRLYPQANVLLVGRYRQVQLVWFQICGWEA